MNIIDLIDEMPDPRMEGKIKHNFGTIIFVTLCGVLSGCESWGDICHYCDTKRKWLEKHINLDNGVPSAWTFRRVFTLLEPSFLEMLLRSYAASIVNKNKASDQIAIDGKVLCGSSRQNLKCLNSVTAWCRENGLVLAEEQVEDKSNEITAIPFLLNSLELKGNTITIDAAGCQKSIVQIIKDKKADYVLGLKRNHPKLYCEAVDHIKKTGANSNNMLHDSFDDKHGRAVRRRYFGYDIKGISQAKDWAGAKSIIAVETISSKTNDPEGKVSCNWRYYLSSHLAGNKKLPDYIRQHWGIENKLHWVLDVHMKEDNDQKAERKSARSFALIKRIALNIVRSKKEVKKISLKARLKRCGWDNDYLLSLLT